MIPQSKGFGRVLFGLVITMALTLLSCGPVKFGKNEFSTTTTQTPTPSPPVTTGTLRDVNSSQTVQGQSNKVDILLIIDDSNSMLPDNTKLADKLSGFVTSLQNSSIDWQMCVTVTRALPVSGNLTWGASIVWSNYTPAAGVNKWVLKPNSDLSNIFTTTIKNIGAGWAGTDDERGIKSAWWHLSHGSPSSPTGSGCYRSDAAFAAIVISDEDERSVGGIKADEYYKGEYQELESDDLPASLVTQVKNVLGANKRFTFNSIIVKPNDSACMTTQDAQGSKSHYGRQYAALSDLTGGGKGSICDADFSANLNVFKDAIQDSLGSVTLECVPVGDVTATVTPTVAGLTYAVQGQNLVFTPQIPAGRTLKLSYKCNQ